MILAQQLGHIVLGHNIDTQYAFNDRMFFSDENTFEHLDFARDPAQEEAADRKAMELLAHSPYKDKLGNAGLFLRALQQEAPDLKNLIRPHLGNSLTNGDDVRMSALLRTAPRLKLEKLSQIAALPLGARVRMDPWSCRLELVKGKPVALTTVREKMPFEVTPFFPYLSRLSLDGADNLALTGAGKH